MPGMPTEVTRGDDAGLLGQRITDRQRRHPIVVIIVDAGGQSAFSPEEIATALRHSADVYVVPDAYSWELNKNLRGDTVYGDAARVFPPPSTTAMGRMIFAAKDAATGDDVIMAARAVAPGRASRGTTNRASHVAVARPEPGLHRVESREAVDALAHHLLDPSRDRPVAVVTIPSHRSEPWIDAQEILDAAGTAGEVHIIATGPRTFQLTGHLNRLAGVFGGAGRVYDVGQNWLDDPYSSPLRFAYDAAEGHRATSALINDLVEALARSDQLTNISAVPDPEVSGLVKGLYPPSRAVVELDSGGWATVWAERTVTGPDIDAIVALGMVVGGRHDRDSGRVDITSMLRSEAQVRASLPVGSIVTATVREVTGDAVTLTPFPGVTAVLSADEVTGNDLDDLSDLFTAGEVVLARFHGAADRVTGRWQLSMIDVDDDEEPVLIPVIEGGPPWLVPTGTSPTPDSTEAPSPPIETADEKEEQEELRSALAAAESRLAAAAQSTRTDDLARRNAELETTLRARAIEVDTLHRELRDERREQDRLRGQLEHERTARRRAALKRGKHKESPAREVMGYADPEDQMRWDILRSWVETTRPEEKEDWPLPQTYRIGDDFVRSVETLEGVSRERVLNVVLRVLTGRSVPDDHPLRESRAGGSPAVTRVRDGVEWVCRRAPLQQSSPSARRLSYWRSPVGEVELSRVTVHDDLTP